MDDLENLITNNKSDFEEQALNREALWDRIEFDLDQDKEKEKPTKVVSIWRPLLRAAAMIIVISSVAFGAYHFGSQSKMANNQPIELVEINAHYVSLINAKMQEVEEDNILSENEKQAFFNAINDLQAEAENLQKELRKNLDNKMVVSAIVHNYKQRLRLLEQLLNRIDKSKSKQNEQSILI